MNRRELLRAGAIGAAAALAGCSDLRGDRVERFDGTVSVDPDAAADEASWAVRNGDPANTRSVPADAAPEPPLSVEWTEGFETHVGHVHPVASDGIALASNWDDDLFAVDVESGARLWTATEAEFEPRSAPVIVDETALIGTRSTVWAFDLADGERLWRTDEPAYVGWFGAAEPTADGDRLLVGTRVGVAAHDLETGERLWDRPVGLPTRAPPASRDGTVYLGGGDATLHALGADDGAVRWRANADDEIRAGPAVTPDRIVVGTAAGTVIAYGRDGDGRWRTDVGDARVEELAVGNGIVCAATEDGAITVVDPESGDRVWRVDRYDASYANGPVVGGGLVFTTLEDAVSATSHRNRTIGAFDAETGDLVWEHDEYRGLQSGPAVVDGTLYLTGRAEGASVLAKLS